MNAYPKSSQRLQRFGEAVKPPSTGLSLSSSSWQCEELPIKRRKGFVSSLAVKQTRIARLDQLIAQATIALPLAQVLRQVAIGTVRKPVPGTGLAPGAIGVKPRSGSRALAEMLARFRWCESSLRNLTKREATRTGCIAQRGARWRTSCCESPRSAALSS
jgi:hypothetical protein